MKTWSSLYAPNLNLMAGAEKDFFIFYLIEVITATVAFFGSEAYIGGDVILFRQATEDSKYLSYVLNGEEAKAFRYRVAKGDIIVHICCSERQNTLL